MSNTLTKFIRGAALGGAGFIVSSAVSAATLEQALVQAWKNNPTLASERDTLAAAESRADASQGYYYPQVKLFGGIGTSHQGVDFMNIPGFKLPISSIVLNTREVGVEVDQPLYAGGRISASSDAAGHLRDAEQAKLHAVEQGVLLDATQAYMDVLQSQAVLALEQSNEKVLQEAQNQAQANFDNGEVTHTDVDQAKARLAGAQSARIQAEGALAAAQANYERIIGGAPENLAQPAPLPGLPASEEAALTLADHNYNVVAAQFVSAAARDNVDVAASALKPSLTLSGQVSKASEPQFLFE